MFCSKLHFAALPKVGSLSTRDPPRPFCAAAVPERLQGCFVFAAANACLPVLCLEGPGGTQFGWSSSNTSGTRVFLNRIFALATGAAAAAAEARRVCLALHDLAGKVPNLIWNPTDPVDLKGPPPAPVSGCGRQAVGLSSMPRCLLRYIAAAAVAKGSSLRSEALCPSQSAE